MRHALGFVVVMIGSGCGGEPGQTFRHGVELICKAEQSSNAAEAAPPERAAVISRWVAQHVSNREARALFGSLAESPATEHAALLAEAARKAGVASCPLAERRVVEPAPAPPDPAPPDPAPASPPAPSEPAPAPARRVPGSVEVTKVSAPSAEAEQAIRDKIGAAYSSSLTRCYRNARADAPDLAGTVTMQLALSPTGRTSHATVEAPNAALGQCIEQSAGSWRFDTVKAAEQVPGFQVELVLTLVP
jgi:hypothetical protein